MADPTNIAIPPARGADPTNILVPVHGTRSAPGIVNAECIVTIQQGTDAGASLTAEVLTRFKAPYRGYIRQVSYSAYDVTGTVTADLFNNTQSAAVFTAVTLTDGVVNKVTSITTPNVNQDDEIQLRVTTAGGGACKGAAFFVYLAQIEGSTTNPL